MQFFRKFSSYRDLFSWQIIKHLLMNCFPKTLYAPDPTGRTVWHYILRIHLPLNKSAFPMQQASAIKCALPSACFNKSKIFFLYFLLQSLQLVAVIQSSCFAIPFRRILCLPKFLFQFGITSLFPRYSVTLHPLDMLIPFCSLATNALVYRFNSAVFSYCIISTFIPYSFILFRDRS